MPYEKTKQRLKALYADDDDDMEGGGFFGSLITKALGKVSDYIVRPPNWNPSKVKYGWLRRPMNMPSLQDLSEMVANTYTNEEDSNIDGYYLWDKTPTVSIFGVEKQRGLYIIALRGTSFRSINDITADLSIVKGIVEDASTYRAIRNGNRWREDTKVIADFKSFVTNYLHIGNPTYYAVGHSLSGAIIDELLEDGIVSSAVSFNPAIERQNFNQRNDNHRVYLECDVLYNLLGKFITNGNIEVIPKSNPAGPDAGPIDTVKGSIECHEMETVIPYMVGKGDNNILPIHNNMSRSSFFDTVSKPSFGLSGLDRFKPIGSPCDSILREPVTQDVGPNSGRERARRRYEACLANNGKEPEAPKPYRNPNIRDPDEDFAGTRPVGFQKPRRQLGLGLSFGEFLKNQPVPDRRMRTLEGGSPWDDIGGLIGNVGMSVGKQFTKDYNEAVREREEKIRNPPSFARSMYDLFLK